MNPLVIILALAAVVVGLCAYAAWSARRRAHDWRDDWCTFDCWAEDGQSGPCEDCAGRRTTCAGGVIDG